MAFFKYPYTNYEKINLDWILRKIKALEPAIPIVEESAAIVARVEQTANDAAQAAQSAQTAVATVTAVAQEAKDTAEEAKEIAQQAASATIADGSVTWPKLDNSVRTIISDNTERSTSASSAAAAAQQTANDAGTAAATAKQTANSASTAAAAAQQTANSASTVANDALALASKTWEIAGTLNNSGDTVYIPATAKEVLFEAFNIGLTPRVVESKFIETTFFDVNNAINFNLMTGELYCIIEASRRVVFDPNGTFTGNALLRVCYK